MLVLGCGFILIWQIGFAFNADALDSEYRLGAASGSRHRYVCQFAYFYYYLRLFPVVTTHNRIQYSQEGARDVLNNHGKTLYMDTPGYWAIRFGHFARAFMYLPDAIIKRVPWNRSTHPFTLSVHPATGTMFILALSGLYFAFWRAKFPILGMFIVLLIGSNPFQLFEVYENENVFGWSITMATLVLAFNVPLILNKKPPKYWLWAAPVLSGCCLGAITHVRTEPALIGISAALVCLTVAGTRWRVRVGLLVILAFSFVTVKSGLQRYFEHKIEEAAMVVEQAGGFPLPPEQYTTHGHWFPIWCGLGDFDEKYGYQWTDGVGYDYAVSILRKKYNIPIKGIRRSVIDGEYLDQAKRYPKKLENMPEVRELMRDKVIHDVTTDPGWYADILSKRIKRIFSMNTPARLAWKKHSIDIPMHAVLLVPSVILLVFFRAWMPLKLVCFTLPLFVPALCVFSGRGMTYYSCFHLILLAFYLALLLEGTLYLAARGYRRKEQYDIMGTTTTQLTQGISRPKVRPRKRGLKVKAKHK